MDKEERRWRIAVAISPRHVVGVIGSNRRSAAAPFRTSGRSPSGWRSSSAGLIAVWVPIVLVRSGCRSSSSSLGADPPRQVCADLTRFFRTSRDSDRISYCQVRCGSRICGAARPGKSSVAKNLPAWRKTTCKTRISSQGGLVSGFG
jgi:hypothetical protein